MENDLHFVGTAVQFSENKIIELENVSFFFFLLFSPFGKSSTHLHKHKKKSLVKNEKEEEVGEWKLLEKNFLDYSSSESESESNKEMTELEKQAQPPLPLSRLENTAARSFAPPMDDEVSRHVTKGQEERAVCSLSNESNNDWVVEACSLFPLWHLLVLFFVLVFIVNQFHVDLFNSFDIPFLHSDAGASMARNEGPLSNCMHLFVHYAGRENTDDHTLDVCQNSMATLFEIQCYHTLQSQCFFPQNGQFLYPRDDTLADNPIPLTMLFTPSQSIILLFTFFKNNKLLSIISLYCQFFFSLFLLFFLLFLCCRCSDGFLVGVDMGGLDFTSCFFFFVFKTLILIQLSIRCYNCKPNIKKALQEEHKIF
ncbi:hypothetical protein RFI_16923 [Reticulomyxa filosa]|uniref:Uncharacterized protein n=1 Tax=Reticulomyxa filosa TaxID=46433 RepID=X6N2I5_RETFI|nr:hypothetical protein RFI_16923 [Reticulomyxa filosa]|eukprot:ETO20296.1 hypothetical protein RFI_16923 [Reticulomyxa filosa]